MSNSKSQDNHVRHRFRERSSLISPALREALVKVAEAAARLYSVREVEIIQYSNKGPAEANDSIEKIRNLAIRNRHRLAYAAARARKVKSPTSYSHAARELAFAFYKLQLSAGIEAGDRMALVEAALRLAERGSARQPSWVTSLRDHYESPHQFSTQASWYSGIGLRSAEALNLLETVRNGLGLPEFELKPSPENLMKPVVAEDVQIPIVDKPSALRVRSLRISNFRGITGDVNLDFLDAAGSPVSCLILGDNGVGKSSIVSAVEFACQNSIGRQPILQTSVSPMTVNLASDVTEAKVVLELNNNTTLARAILREDGIQRVDTDSVPGPFQLAPMSLQRSDIIQFLNTSASERGRLFVRHFSSRSAQDDSPQQLVALKEKRIQLRQRRRGLVKQLAGISGEIDVPNARHEVMHLFRKTFFEGLTRPQWERMTGRSAPPEATQFGRSYEELNREIAHIDAQIKALHAPTRVSLYEFQVKRLSALLGDIGQPMTRALKDIAGIDWIKDLSVSFGQLSAISVELTISFTEGQSLTPESVFSEGIQDLIAVLFFLEIAHAAAARGQARILILDDVMQSVDSTIRVRLLDYLLERFGKWQFLITVHDRLWREQIVQIMRRRGHRFVEREIRRWTFSEGPQIRSTSYDNLAPLSDALENGNTAMIAAEAGRLLEQVSDVLSWSLPVNVSRRPNDLYTLGDLWPAVSSKLRKTSIARVAEEVDRWLHLRNLLGAHYNEWAESLSQMDVDSFATAIKSLYQSVYCDKCHHWVRGDGFQVRWLCRCGAVAFGLNR
jgi:recombinational DNA repair ATPase RecF